MSYLLYYIYRQSSDCETKGILIMYAIYDRTTMIYDYENKVLVAKYLGVELSEVNVEFNKWMELKEKYLHLAQEGGKE